MYAVMSRLFFDRRLFYAALDRLVGSNMSAATGVFTPKNLSMVRALHHGNDGT
jgi:hypothetical protein